MTTTLVRDNWPPSPGWIGFAAGTRVKVMALGVAPVGIQAVATDVAIVNVVLNGFDSGILLRVTANELQNYYADGAKPEKKKAVSKKKAK